MRGADVNCEHYCNGTPGGGSREVIKKSKEVSFYGSHFDTGLDTPILTGNSMDRGAGSSVPCAEGSGQ